MTDSRLNAQLFKRGVPKCVEELHITGYGRFVPKGAPNPQVQYLDTLIREFHPRLSNRMFPDLKGLAVHVGRKSDQKDRREMWEVIRSFAGLTALYVEPADRGLPWSDLPSGLKRLKPGNGDLDDLSALHVFGGLEYLHLHFLRSLVNLDGIEAFPELRAVVLIGMDRLADHDALLRMPKLEFFHRNRLQHGDSFAALEARGVTVRG